MSQHHDTDNSNILGGFIGFLSWLISLFLEAFHVLQNYDDKIPQPVMALICTIIGLATQMAWKKLFKIKS